MMTLPEPLRRWMLLRMLKLSRSRPPDFVIGSDYLSRWWVIPRNKIFNIYSHRISRDDDDRALHDHPWWNVSIILRGAYAEHVPDDGSDQAPILFRWPGTVIVRRAKALHRLAVLEGPVWSLFITGPRLRTWGFQCPQGWRPWYEFVDSRDAGKVGRGCD